MIVNKRLAGHSKWQNIKHAKAEIDNQKMMFLSSITRKMEAVIKEQGTAKPSENLLLARLIDQAKKANIPTAKIDNIIERITSSKSHSGTIELRGPGCSIFILEYLSRNRLLTRNNVKSAIKKLSVDFAEPSVKNMFDHKGIIITNVKDSLDVAIDDAVSVDAEDVELIENDSKEALRFVCDVTNLNKVKNKLENMKYNVQSADNEYIPNTYMTLNDEQLAAAKEIYNKLLTVDDIVNIYDNIK